MELTFLNVIEKLFMYSRFMSIVDFFWFMVYAELFDQYVQCMSDTIDMCQKPQIRSDTHLRRPIRDEMDGTSMFGLSFFSMIHGCDHARPCVDGTTCVTCTLMRISSGCIHTCHTNGNFPGKLGTVESPLVRAMPHRQRRTSARTSTTTAAR